MRKKGSLRELAENALLAAQFYNTFFPPEPTAPPPVIPPDPMAGMASAHELAQYAMKPGAFYLGRAHEDHGVNFRVGVQDDRHGFMVAGNRSGKGLTIGIPNILQWRGPVFAIDPKAEAASIAGMRRAKRIGALGTGTSVRHFVGQDVAILDPFEQTRGPARVYRVSYNPLIDIDMEDGGGVRAIFAAADALIHGETGSGVHFAETAQTIVTGVIEAIKLKEPPANQTLGFLRERLLAGFDDLLFYLSTANTKAGLAREAAAIMSEVGGNEWGSFRSTLSRSLKWLAEPAMQNHLAASDFSLKQAVQSGASIFIALPPTEIHTFRSWLRLIVRIALDAKVAMGINQQSPQTLFFLDEFSALGPFKIIEESAGFLASYGIKLVPVIQNIGQIKNLYAKNWETFLGNAGAIVGFGLNDYETERYFSDRMGRVFITETGESFSVGANGQAIGGGINSGQSFSTSRHERPVRLPNEIHDQGARETMRGFVIPASGRAFTIRREPYTAFPKGTFDSPDFIARWEATFGASLKSEHLSPTEGDAT